MAPKRDKTKGKGLMSSKLDKSKTKKEYTSSAEPEELISFDLEQLEKITNNWAIKCGSGTFATVYRGEWGSQEVAVKIYPPAKKNLAQFEMNAFEDLRGYSNIVPLVGTCFSDKSCSFVMKYIPSTLKEMLADCTLIWPETLNILTQLTYAIRAIVTENYVVADIKPDNILMDKDHSLYLCDFGSAVKGGKGLPTVNNYYAAKEAFRREGNPDKTDIYSFGVILLQMVMKCNEFGEVKPKDSLELLVKQLRTPSSSGKHKKKEKNSSNQTSPHITVIAWYEMSRGHHIVHKSLIESGCDYQDAMNISQLAKECTNDYPEQRPEIEKIISILEGMKNKKMVNMKMKGLVI